MQTSSGRAAAAPAALKLWMVLCMLFLNAVQHPRAVRATDDVLPCELESAINQLVYPGPEYQLHASALRNQLRNILRERQLAVGEEQSLGDSSSNSDYDYPDEDKRSVAALAAQGLLHPGSAKRSLATLAKNGQLPTPDPSEEVNESSAGGPDEEKRYVGALARSGGFMGYGKRNIGTLARDFQLPQPQGKRNLATLARLGLLSSPSPSPKRNLAAVARYNSNRMGAAAAAEKRNLGALKGSPVHGAQQKREREEVVLPASLLNAAEMDYMEVAPNYWLAPSYADMDWDEWRRAQKRFLDTSKDPELFGIENGAIGPPSSAPIYNLPQEENDEEEQEKEEEGEDEVMLLPAVVDEEDSLLPLQQKRHIGAVYRSGFFPSYRNLRSITGSYGGGGGGRFSRSGRARQFV